MNKTILTAILLLYCFYSKGQSYNTILTKRAETLLSSGVDTLLLFVPCQGLFLEPLKDSCRFRYRKYLIWQKEQKIYLEKAADCFNEEGSSVTELISKTLSLDSSSAYKFLLTNFKAIKYETLLPAIIRQKVGEHYAYSTIDGSHQCYTFMDIFTKNDRISKRFSELSLHDDIILRNDDGSIRETIESVNYDYNKSTSLYRLSLLLDTLIDNLEKAKTIKF